MFYSNAERAVEGIKQEKAKRKSPETAVPGEEPPFKATVISSDDGAKVVQNLETLAKDAKDLDLAGKKNFIGNLATALEVHHEGSNSQYADFETVNGKIVTIRLADHNAAVSKFDYAERENAISGNKVSYKYTDKGVTFTVTTETKGKGEVFTNFFTNRKPTVQNKVRRTPQTQRVQPQQSGSGAKLHKVADKASVEDKKHHRKQSCIATMNFGSETSAR